jgi:hypothetical protein
MSLEVAITDIELYNHYLYLLVIYTLQPYGVFLLQ